MAYQGSSNHTYYQHASTFGPQVFHSIIIIKIYLFLLSYLFSTVNINVEVNLNLL